MSQTCMCTVNEKLEAERYDQSWRTPLTLPEPKVITRPCTRQHATPAEACQRTHITLAEQEARDQLLFNAGRYAAGARDSVAVKANEAYFASIK